MSKKKHLEQKREYEKSREELLTFKKVKKLVDKGTATFAERNIVNIALAREADKVANRIILTPEKEKKYQHYLNKIKK